MLVRHAEEEEVEEGMGRAPAWHQPGSSAGAGGQHRGLAVGEVLGHSEEECCASGEPAAQPLGGSGRVGGVQLLLRGTGMLQGKQVEEWKGCAKVQSL